MTAKDKAWITPQLRLKKKKAKDESKNDLSQMIIYQVGTKLIAV